MTTPNWWQSGWNQQPGQQQPPAEQTPQGGQQQTPPATPLPQSAEDLQKFIAAGTAKTLNDYQEFARKNQAELEGYTKKFQEDKELAPYLPVAVQHFVQLQAVNPNLPNQALYDMTVQHVHHLRGIGVQPPPAAQAASGGIPSHSVNGAMVPLGDARFRPDEQGMQVGFYPDDARQADTANYVKGRKMDLEYGLSKGTLGKPFAEAIKELSAGERSAS